MIGPLLFALAACVFTAAVGVAVAFAAHEIATRRAKRVDHQADARD